VTDEFNWDDSMAAMDTVYAPMDVKVGLLERLRTVSQYLHEDSGTALGPRLIYKMDGKLCYLPLKESITVGRSKRASLTIDSPELSRIHFKIEYTDKGILFDDQGSTNGVHVNDEKVQEAFLVSGDLLRAGQHLFVFVED
jgi:hypothetical protein